ncbi:50S ribosomal protein L25 [Akkermansiaceae bacterium]|nr:50S ribosomal protein L25 [Akkermansiaceae bacterium]MDB4538026.1 50S ribosomal protein L25 [Akkermansiaceae bacterium]
MANTLTLSATTRQRTGSGVLKQMRREGYLPSVVYGKGQENLNIKVHTKTLTDMLAHSASESILVDLEIDGGKSQTAFLQSTQHDALTGTLVHADFLAVTAGMKITASLPVEVHGEPIGVKSGGILEQMIRDLEISCAPKDLPEKIHANIEHLKVGDSISVSDLDLPDGVTPTLAGDVLVAIVNESRVTKSEGAAGGGEEEAEAAPAAEE